MLARLSALSFAPSHAIPSSAPTPDLPKERQYKLNFVIYAEALLQLGRSVTDLGIFR